MPNQGVKNPLAQPRFDSRLNALSFPLAGPQPANGFVRGYMRQYQPLPNYARTSVFHFQYNPSTVSADYSLADASAQASLNFPNPGDTSQLAIPLSQTVSWALMFDRTYELWGAYHPDGTTRFPNAAANDPRVIGVEADVMQLKDFTGMLTNYSYGTNGAGGTLNAPSQAAQNYSLNQGIMQLVMCYAYFGSSGQANNTQYFGYINEWSVQYTHFTQYNIAMRCVVNISFTMMPPPAQNTTTKTQSAQQKNNFWYIPEQVTRNATNAQRQQLFSSNGTPNAALSTNTNGKAGR